MRKNTVVGGTWRASLLIACHQLILTPQPFRTVWVFLSRGVNMGVRTGKSLSGLYLRHCKVKFVWAVPQTLQGEVDIFRDIGWGA